jgi:nucleotide-binding universal stress UspA family protein
VGGAHPRLEGTERVFDSLPSYAHRLGHAVESVLHGVKDAFVFPALDPIVSQIVLDALEGLKMAYPKTTAKRHAELLSIREQLVNRGRDVHQHPDPDRGVGTPGKAVRHGIASAQRIGAKVTALTVSSPFHMFTTDTQMIEYTPAQYKARMQDLADKTLGAIADASRTAGVACGTLHVEHEHAYRAIIDTADAKACDLIVMASHDRRDIAAIVLGSETLKVLTHCKIPVLVHR